MDRLSKVGQHNIVRNMFIGLILGIIVMACFLLFTDFQKVRHSIVNLPVHYLLLAFFLTFCSYLLRLWKWHAFTTWCQFNVTLRQNIVIFFIGLMMSITPGKAGELIKAYILQRKANVQYAKSIPIIIYDRFTDLIAMLVLISIGLFVYPIGLTSLIIFSLLIVLFFIVIQKRTFVKKIIHFITGKQKVRRFRKPLNHFYDQTLFLMQYRYLSFSFLVSLASWFLECVSLYFIIKGFGLDVSFVATILVFSLGTIAGALSMIPGGLGVAEGSITGLLVYFGVTGSLAITISLIIRIVTLWFGVILGIIVFIFNRKSYFK